MKTLLFTLLLVLGLTTLLPTVNAQEINFDLSTYKLPDYKREMLDFNFNLSGSNNRSNRWSSVIDDDGSRSTNLSNTINASYFGFTNTAYQQKTLAITALIPTYYYKRNSYSGNYDYTNESLSMYPSISSEFVNRNFIQDKTYFETNFNGSLGANFYKKSGYPDDSYFHAFAEIPLKIGTGRIEEVQDARQAVYILQALQDNQLLSITPDDSAIVVLATQISLLKTERYLDSRIHKIKELETIDSFLRENRYINTNSITYFSVLNDMWSFGRNQVRKSGTSAALAAYPGMGILTQKYGDSKSSVLIPSLSGGFEFSVFKPLSLKTQNNTIVKLLGGFTQIKETDNDYKSQFPHLRLSLEQSLGIYPNTRTDFNIFFNGSIIKFLELKDDDPNVWQPDALAAVVRSGINWNYYLSARFRLNFNWSLNFEWQEDTDASAILFTDVFNAYTFIDNLNANFFPNSNAYNKERYLSQSFSIKLLYSLF
ncbi:MAG: hypothetical protein AB7E36_06425 [Salinivirgaceae bacterium]